MSVVLIIMIALSILVPPKGTQEIRFHQRLADKEYASDVEYVIRRNSSNKYILYFYDRSDMKKGDQPAAPPLAITVVSKSQHRFRIAPVKGKEHPYFSQTKKKELDLAKLIEIPPGDDFRSATELKQVMFPKADGRLRD